MNTYEAISFFYIVLAVGLFTAELLISIGVGVVVIYRWALRGKAEEHREIQEAEKVRDELARQP